MLSIVDIHSVSQVYCTLFGFAVDYSKAAFGGEKIQGNWGSKKGFGETQTLY